MEIRDIRTAVRMRKFPPLAPTHPLVGDEKHRCPACEELFAAGDIVTLLPVGPGNDADNQAKARDGKAYTAIALPVHWACATGEVKQ